MKLYMKKFVLFVLFVLNISILLGQTNLVTISGKISDEFSNEPLEFVNVILLSADSLYINGTTTDTSGMFILNDIPCGKGIIKISLIGYESILKDVQIDKLNTSLGNFRISQNSKLLNEVTITSTLPQYKIKDGNLITNVQNTLLSTIGTATEVIGQIPGISLNNDNEITVFGKGIPIVYINNRKVYDTGELNQLQSTDILSIELLKNPGAKYDAQNKSVIIIKTKAKDTGFSINATSKIWIHNYAETAQNIHLAYSNRKLNTFLSYNYIYLKNKTEENSDYYLYKDTTWTQTIDQPYIFSQKYHDISTSFDYSFTDKQIAGIQYKGNFASSRDNSDSHQEFRGNDILFETIAGNRLRKQSPKTHLFNLFYNGNFNDKFDLRLDMDYMNKKSPSDQFTNEESSISANSRSLIIYSNSDFKLWAGKLTGTYNIGKSSKLEFGSEFNTITGKGFYINDKDTKNNNTYTNDEDKVAAFASYSASINDLDVSLGLRYEHSHEKSTKDSVKTVKSDKYYNDLYPNLTLSKTFGEVAVSLSANKRTRRPSFSELTGNDLYVNPFLTQKGNPYLKKENYYDINSYISYKDLNIGIGYTYVERPISIDFIDDNNSQESSIISYANYKKYQNLNAMISYNYRIGFWKPQLSIGIMQPFFSAIYREEKRNYNKTSLGINFTNDLILPRDLIVSLYFNYQNETNYYLVRDKGYTEFNIRVRKSFLDKKLNLNLYGGDIFNMKKEENKIQVKDYNMILNKKRTTRYVSFTIQYLFNNTKKHYRGQNASSDDINRL